MRQQVERLAPANVSSSVARRAQGLGREVRGAVADGRATMRATEARLSADLDPDRGRRHPG